MKLTFQSEPSPSLHIKYISKSHSSYVINMPWTHFSSASQLQLLSSSLPLIIFSSMLSRPSVLSFIAPSALDVYLCDTSLIHLLLHSLTHSTAAEWRRPDTPPPIPDTWVHHHRCGGLSTEKPGLDTGGTEINQTWAFPLGASSFNKDRSGVFKG